MINIALSVLPHTWLIDVDGTILRHNGHKQGSEKLLSGVREFWLQIPADDFIILLSARTNEEKAATLQFLIEQDLRFDQAIFGLPKGERVLINDVKPKGLNTAISINIKRDIGLDSFLISTNQSL